MDEKISASTSPTVTSAFEKDDDIEAQIQGEKTERWFHPSRLWPFSTNDEIDETAQDEIDREKAITTIETRVLEDCPNGYPRLAAFLASESSFALFRGFNYLHTRLLLEKQYEISRLEQELDELDRTDDTTDMGKKRLGNRDLDNRRARNDEYRSRQEILDEIHRKLLEYDELLLKARDTFALQKPSSRDYRSVRTWFSNSAPLTLTQASFIEKKEDIITLRSGREWSEFDGFIERLLKKCDFFGWNNKLLCTPELRAKSRDPCVYYYSTSRVESFVGALISVMVMILMVIPVWIMCKLTASGTGLPQEYKAVGVWLVFTLLFSMIISLLTRARRHELFAAAAAYAAVLVVFLTNYPMSQTSGK